jgi:catecholate siderophore receptor
MAHDVSIPSPAGHRPPRQRGNRQQDTTTQTVTGKKAEAAETGTTCATSRSAGNARRAKDIPQSVTVINDKLIHDRNLDTAKKRSKKPQHTTLFGCKEVGDNIRLRFRFAAGR